LIAGACLQREVVVAPGREDRRRKREREAGSGRVRDVRKNLPDVRAVDPDGRSRLAAGRDRLDRVGRTVFEQQPTFELEPRRLLADRVDAGGRQRTGRSVVTRTRHLESGTDTG
jgi:hypothetical protein